MRSLFACSLWSRLHCWTADWAEKSTAVEFDSILRGRPNQISLICVGRQQKLFFFLHLHTVVKLFFNDIIIFKTRHRDKIVLEVCECGQWTEFAKTSVRIILVVLVYLVSAEVYTGPKIVHVVKRFRNTDFNTYLLVVLLGLSLKLPGIDYST